MNATPRPIRWWVRAYTAGLSADARERRRAEIESDVWDQLSDLDAERPYASHRTRHWPIWMRWLAGIPDDVLWRLEQPSQRDTVQTSERRTSMSNLRMDRLSVVPLIVVVVAIIGALASVVVGNIQHFEQSQRFVASATLDALSLGLFVGGLAAIPLGFVLMPRSPAGGALLSAGGAIVAGVVTFWLIVPLILAAAVSYLAFRRARRLARER